MSDKNKIIVSNVAEFFSKNLQQIGFSSPAKATLFTLKESVDNSLDAIDTLDGKILPEISVIIDKLGDGHTKNSDKIRLVVSDNGPGIDPAFVSQVFGVFLASSKASRQSPSRGSQGLGISAAVNWAQLTQARGVYVITKTSKMKKAYSCIVECDTKHNKGIIKNEKEIEWDRPHGTEIELIFDGKIILNGESSITAYLEGTALVNPALTLKYKILDNEVVINRVTDTLPIVPDPILPHPHTLKLGEFITNAHQYSDVSIEKWLKTGFSRVNDSTIGDIIKHGFDKRLIKQNTDKLKDNEIKDLYQIIQKLNLQEPSTKAVMSIGEDALSKSVQRFGNIDFFSVVTRKPTICDFRPIQIEVAIARVQGMQNEDDPVKVQRFANRVPLIYSKNGCITTEAIKSVNWKAYGLSQSKESLPAGPYVISVSIVSPGMKFTNAAKECIAGDIDGELFEEIRLALIQAGQRLSKFVKKEAKEADLERKRQYIEQFAPILIDCLFELSGEPKSRKARLEKGLAKILGRDTEVMEQEVEQHNLKIEKEAQNVKNK